MLVIGGITRLTGSGLSMTDWNLVMGTFPPTTEAAWEEAFAEYRQFPEYRQLNRGMSLADFKAIYFWEYLHRLMGRIIGVVFLIPFFIFWIRGCFDKKLFRRVLFLFGLGALQGAMGWIMVKSGLVDVPRVSHYRLALHFLLAVLLITFSLWFALDLDKNYRLNGQRPPTRLKKWVALTGIIFLVQIIWGAFTAGLDAGTMYNTFPLMNQGWMPRNAWVLDPFVINLVENPGTVQWVHRTVGTLLGLIVTGLWVSTRFSAVQSSLKIKADLLLGLILVQYLIGIFTLLHQVPLMLGVIHQVMAVIFCIALLFYYHELENLLSETT